MRFLTNPNPPAASAAGGARVATVGDRLALVRGVPARIALHYRTGKEVRSPKNGAVDVMFTLVDGRRAFFPIKVAEAIAELGLGDKEPFEVIAHGVGDWEVNRIHQAAASAVADTAPAPRQHQTNARPPEDSAPPQAPRQLMNGAGETTAQMLSRCYASAIDIASDAQAAARGKGLMVTATFEDLRACAAVLFISESGGRK